MTKRLSSKYKICRRLGVNLWGRPKSPTNKRDYGPGQHGQRRRKPTDYGIQLSAKQKLRGYYGNITEHQFRRTYAEAARLRGDTGENLIGLLERRLDAVVYRLKFVPTVFAARQFVNHGHILVNAKRVNIPSSRGVRGASGPATARRRSEGPYEASRPAPPMRQWSSWWRSLPAGRMIRAAWRASARTSPSGPQRAGRCRVRRL